MKENVDSLYANVIAVRESDKDNPRLKSLVEALHSPEVKQVAERLFHHQAIPAWENQIEQASPGNEIIGQRPDIKKT